MSRLHEYDIFKEVEGGVEVLSGEGNTHVFRLSRASTRVRVTKPRHAISVSIICLAQNFASCDAANFKRSRHSRDSGDYSSDADCSNKRFK
jgi:hypothetical protein